MLFTGRVGRILLVLLVVALPRADSAAEITPSQEELVKVSEAYLARKPASGLSTGLTYRAALEAQREYVAILEKSFGERAGYKVALVTKAGQERNNIDHPVRGVLFKEMLLTNGSEVPTNYGTRPILEPDLLVLVKDERINEARTPQETMEHLSEIVCFIELADATFATNAPVDAGVITAANVGARLGVMGQSRVIEPNNAFYAGWQAMALVLRDGKGRELSRVTADGVMGHPLNAVFWLIQDLKRTGEKLNAGDVISLGSPSAQVSPKAGEKYVLSYEGLPGGELKATVSFK